MERIFFDQPVKSDMRTSDCIRKIATGKEMMINWLFARL